MTRRDPLAEASLLGVFAHPDDESLACGGLLARCSQEGARVSLLCLTRGERGPGSSSAALGDVRARELLEAANVLGVSRVVQLEYEDGMLPWIDPALLEAEILSMIGEVRPDVVITFDEDGLYGHPDHVAVHERTTAVVARLGSQAPALRYASMPRGAMRELARTASSHRAAAGGSAAADPVIFGDLDADAFGAMAPPPTFVMDIASCAIRKVQALRCHRTQIDGSVFDELDERDVARILSVEQYRHAPVGSADSTFIERLSGISVSTARG